MRENRVNRERKDLHCPKPLVSFVTENGSGPSLKMSYDPVREGWGQVNLLAAFFTKSTRLVSVSRYLQER